MEVRSHSLILLGLLFAVLGHGFFATGYKIWSMDNLKYVIPDRVIDTDTGTVEFLLYPRKESLNYREELVYGDAESIKASSYNSSLPIILLIHGFVTGSKTRSGFTEVVKNAYLHQNTAANIVAVDWSDLSTPKLFLNEGLYELAALNVKPVGRKVADFLLFLVKEGFLSGPQDIHIVGFSLGAHVSGKAGRYFLQDSGKLIARITGLDPAGPAFNIKIGTAGILDSTDAEFVDILHTNPGQLGYRGVLGHVDFYANGMGKQPNCSFITVTTGGCSHSAAYRYFAKSIRDPSLIACECDKTFRMSRCLNPCEHPLVFGEFCPTTARGVYYLPITYDDQDLQ